MRSAISRLKPVLNKHGLLLGFLAATIPLLFILFLQYRSLATLESTLPAYRRSEMRVFLEHLVDSTQKHYREQAERALALPPSVYDSAARLPESVQGAAEHFRERQFKGAKRYFFVVEADRGSQKLSAALFYDPETQRMKFDPQLPEWRAVHLTCASYVLLFRTGRAADAEIVKATRTDGHLLLIKPVVDEEKSLLGVAGITVDEDYIRNEYLPELARTTRAATSSLADYFSPAKDDLIVTLKDGTSGDAGARVILGAASNAGDGAGNAAGEVTGDVVEAEAPFTDIFQGWKLEVRFTRVSAAQWARQYFYLNVALWATLALLLTAGLLMALRTAAREVKLSQMKSDFVSNVSHELRTPLASIRVFGEFFRLGMVKEPERMREFGEYIEIESRRLTQIINNILDFARIESGQRSYRFEPVDLAGLVAETLGTLRIRLEQGGFEAKFSAPAGRVEAAVDAEAMIQVFVNLIDNAVKYSGAAREIEVRVESEGEWAVVAVSDRGIGIPEEDQEKIFDRFHRVSTGLVHDVKGSGLGLAIVKHIVEAHGGSVGVKSAPGRGSTFYVRLPLRKSAALRPDEQETKESGALPQPG